MSELSADQESRSSQSSKPQLGKSSLAVGLEVGGMMMGIIMLTWLAALMLGIVGVIGWMPRQASPVLDAVGLMLPGVAVWVGATGVGWAVAAIVRRLHIAPAWAKVVVGAILGAILGFIAAGPLGATAWAFGPLVSGPEELAQWARVSATIGVITAIPGMLAGAVAALETIAKRPTAGAR